VARDPAAEQDAAPVGELPVYIQSEERRSPSHPLRWKPACDALVMRAVVRGGIGLAVVLGALVAARGLGPAAAEPTDRLLLGGALLSGSLVGGVGGAWAARWPRARLRGLLDRAQGTTLPGPPVRSAATRAALAFVGAVATVALALGVLALAGVAGYLLGVVLPLITLVNTAGLVVYWLVLLRARYATIDGWERDHPGRVVIGARVRTGWLRRGTAYAWVRSG
jgi:hypothetical protein